MICSRPRMGVTGPGTRPLGPRESPEQCATLARVGMIATKIFGLRSGKAGPGSWRSLVALAAIVVLTATLAGRTFEVQLTHCTSITASGEKAKIQHRDNQKSRSSQAVSAVRPLYLLVTEAAIEPEQKPPLSVHVDQCRYNRPPPQA